MGNYGVYEYFCPGSVYLQKFLRYDIALFRDNREIVCPNFTYNKRYLKNKWSDPNKFFLKRSELYFSPSDR